MSAAAVMTLAVLAALLAAAPAGAEIVRDGRDGAGPLDITRVKLGQHDLSLLVTIEAATPLPKLNELGPHPTLRPNDRARYLCLNIASHSIGRRLLCPSGRIKHGGIDLGVSKVGSHGAHGAGSIRARIQRGKRSLTLDIGLRSIGLAPGKLSFAAQSGWFGPGCNPRAQTPQAATCTDRAPQRDSGRTRIYPVRRTGCGGFSQNKVFNGPRGRKEVALTFDDGPSAYTPQVLRILSDHRVHATFFDIGQEVPRFPEYARKVLAQGSELGNHSLHHEDGPGRASLAETNAAIRSATGFTPCMFRPPGGFLPSSTLTAAESLDLVSVLWDTDTRDYTLPGSGTIADRATDVRPGSIVLMHDGGGPRSQTVEALPRIIEKLKSRGYRLVTMTELLGGRYRLSEDHGHRRLAEAWPLAKALPTPFYPGP